MNWYVATCERCRPRLPQPFRDEAQRDDWAIRHTSATGHQVTRTEESEEADGG